MASNNHREKGNKFCLNHPKKELIFACDDCSNTPVCSLCISTTHKGHTVTDLDLLAPTKYNFIQDFNHEIQTDTIPTIENNISSAEASVSEFEQSISADIDRVEGQRQSLKSNIDDIADTDISALKDILQKYKTLLQEFQSASENTKKRLEELCHDNKETLKSNENILLIDTAEELKDRKIKPEIFVEIPIVKFPSAPKANRERLIKEAFGYIQIIDESGSHDLIGAPALDMPSTTGKRRKTLLQQHSLQTTRKLSFDACSIKVTKDGTIVCASGLTSNKLYLLQTTGDIREFTFEMNIHDIAVHPVTDTLYVIMQGQTVATIDRNTGRLTGLFIPEGILYSCALAFTNDGNILIGDRRTHLVTLYSTECKKIRTFTYGGSKPSHIAVCKTTDKIAIACSGKDSDNLFEKLQFMQDSVLVHDKNFKELYKFCIPEIQGFQCPDVVFDIHGYMLVSTIDKNQGIYIVDAEKGTHMKTISTAIGQSALCLTIDNDDHVVVGTLNPLQLLTFKYLK